MMAFPPGYVLLAFWLLLQFLSFAGVLNFWYYMPREASAELTEAPSGVVAIIPVKGPLPNAGQFVEALLAQSTMLRAIFVVESTDDPAWHALCRLANDSAPRVQLVVSGLAVDEGQKIHNTLAAVATLGPDDRYLVFLDADILPARHVIGRVLHPLVRQGEMIASGYRWCVPSVQAPSSWLGAAINLQVATFPRRRNRNLPWGGITAMSRETFEHLDLKQAWRGVLVDDLMLFRTARRNGVDIRSISDLILPSTGATTLGGLWQFGVRQYRHLFWNVPTYWAIAATAVGLQSIGWAWALLLGGKWAILVGYGGAMARAGIRTAIARRLSEAGELRPALSILPDLATPFLVNWVHLLMILAAPLSRRIRWAGIDYWMLMPGKVGRMRRPAR
jgi:hypothetical protein